MIRKYETDGLLKATRDHYTFEIGHGGVKRTLRFVETDALATSSTLIREQFALGKKEQIKPYLKAEVFDYIERKSLYGA
jgi:nicotinic acid mononucleotide adenylyltransferase